MSALLPSKTGEVRGRSLPELRELLKRQERLLRDRKLISRLPDKGKKISDFLEKLKLAIAHEEEVKRTNELLSAVRLEFQAKQEEINTGKQRIVTDCDKSTNGDDSAVPEHPAPNMNKACKPAVQDQEAKHSKKRSTNVPYENASRKPGQRERTSEGQTKIHQSNEGIPELSSHSLLETDQQKLKYSLLGQTDSEADASSNSDDRGLEEREPEKEQNAKDHPFGSLSHKMPKKPHYIEVLESRAKNPVVKKEKFKTNTFPIEWSGSSHGSSPTHSPGRSGSLISPEERRLRDKKHLDDITSARIPPLHHTPAQLLSIEESIAIQKQQKEVYEEMQAKLAAQKLAEKLNIKMVSYEPEGEMSMKYKEIRDEEDNDSSED